MSGVISIATIAMVTTTRAFLRRRNMSQIDSEQIIKQLKRTLKEMMDNT